MTVLVAPAAQAKRTGAPPIPTKMKLLVYVREYFKFNYLPLFDAVPDAEVDYLTDFPTPGMQNIRDLFYREIADQPAKQSPEFDVDDVIRRCRLLRNINKQQARAMAIAMHAVMKKVVEESRCVVVVGQIVDDYITHVLAIVAETRGLRYVGLCASYFQGYTQVSESTNGSPVNVRTVSLEEAREVFGRIGQSNFRMDYAQPSQYSRLKHAKRVLRYYAKITAFRFLKIYRSDSLNYHYSVQKYLGQPKSFFNFPGKDSFQQDWEQRIESTSRRLVYMPLAFFPESSTDYWVSSPRFLNYQDEICSIATALARDNLVVIKEHTHMLGIRDLDFYAQLRSLPNVVMVPPEVVSNTLLKKYHPIVFVGTGSVGLEATLRKLPVVTFSSTSYWYGPSRAAYVSGESNEAICEAVARAVSADTDPVEFVRSCLQTMLPFDYMQAHMLEPDILAQIRPFVAAPP